MTVAVAPIDGEIVDESLTELAARANAYHDQAERSACAALEFAVRCGEELIKAKGKLEYGEWSYWVKHNFQGTLRTAQRYMELAPNTTRVSLLPSGTSINEALRKIKAAQKPKPVPDKPKPEEPAEEGDVTTAVDRAYVGRSNYRRQIETAVGVESQLRAIAFGLEHRFEDAGGFEKTFTPEVAAELSKSYEKSIARIQRQLALIKNHGKGL